MAGELHCRRVAILATDGVERVELEQPRSALHDAAAQTDLLSLHGGEIQARNNDLDPAGTFGVDGLVADAAVDDYDALLLPGGTVNPDRLRMDRAAVGFVRDFVGSGKPVAAICHGPWTLLEAGVVTRPHDHVVPEPPHRPAQRRRERRRPGGGPGRHHRHQPLTEGPARVLLGDRRAVRRDGRALRGPHGHLILTRDCLEDGAPGGTPVTGGTGRSQLIAAPRRRMLADRGRPWRRLGERRGGPRGRVRLRPGNRADRG